ncbi:LysR family transcriptional regulator [Ferrimonas lipolytica]|uniref:LysR family transcriptional regulator n=1 Tax=Ferrimonas lipolytica TaxID=2724191 RepID=A0A6H1UC59_9GAMM|nr:LysR family transcriptional regulator [Ferrimonas lipolytica]QIZ76229.1 LysR family transcriptional regulator [Ferrimonas lipolytica]
MERFKNLRFSSLQIFEALHEERSAVAVGRRLSLSQSSVSYELKRLREALDDELFIRTRDGLVPNKKANAVYQKLPELYQLFSEIFPLDSNILPTHYSGVVRVDVIEPLCLSLIPKIHALITANCPKVKLKIKVWGDDSADNLANGSVDLAVHANPINDNKIISYRGSIAKRAVVCNLNHSVLKNSAITLEDLTNYPLILPDVSTTRKYDYSLIESICDQHNLTPYITMRIGYLPAAIEVVKSTNSLYFSSEKSLRVYEDQVAILPAPPELNKIDRYHYILQPKNKQNSNFHVWFRNEVKTLLEQSH